MATNPTDHANGRIVESADDRVSTDVDAGTGAKLLVGVIVLAVVLAGGFLVAHAVRSREADAVSDRTAEQAGATPTVETLLVRATPDVYPLTLPGQTAGWYQSPLYARVDGYINSWVVDIGDRVKQGQKLATIDTPELDQQLAAAKAKADASDAQVSVAQSNQSIAKLTYDRWRDSPRGVVSDQEREEKQANFEAAKAHLVEAGAQAQLDRAEVARYQAMSDFRNVTAPYDGVITARNCDVGDLVNAGSSGSTRPLYTMAQSNMIRVFVDVPQKAAADMVPGLGADTVTDVYPGRLFPGKVARSARSIDQQTRTERVEVDIPNGDLALIPGMYVQVTFRLAQHGLVEVPAAAILTRPTGVQVAAVTRAGTIDFRPVVVAKDNGDIVELSAGVAAGDRVVLNISNAIAQGDAVTAADDEKDRGIPTTRKSHAE